MKKFTRILPVFFAVVIFPSMSMGMGYPQDMFAEHVTTKRATMPVQPKKVRKENVGAQKAASSRTAQKVGMKRTPPCKSTCVPKNHKGNRQANTHSSPLAIVPACRKVCIISVKTCKLDGNDVEEQGLPLDEFLNEGRMS